MCVCVCACACFYTCAFYTCVPCSHACVVFVYKYIVTGVRVCSDNRLSKLPAAVCRLAKMQFLAIDSNQLTELPLEINLMQSLTVLVGGKREYIPSSPHLFLYLPNFSGHLAVALPCYCIHIMKLLVVVVVVVV